MTRRYIPCISMQLARFAKKPLTLRRCMSASPNNIPKGQQTHQQPSLFSLIVIPAVATLGTVLGATYYIYTHENAENYLKKSFPSYSQLLGPYHNVLVRAGALKPISAPESTKVTPLVQTPVEKAPKKKAEVEKKEVVEDKREEEVYKDPYAIEEPQPASLPQTEDSDHVVHPTPEEQADQISDALSVPTTVDLSPTPEPAITPAPEEQPSTEMPVASAAVANMETAQQTEEEEDTKPSLRELGSDRLETIFDSIDARAHKLKKELEYTLERDLDGLTEQQLKERLTQLYSDFYERIQYENQHTQRLLKQLRAEFAHDYHELMLSQHNEMLHEKEKALMQKEMQLKEEHHKALENALTAYETRLENALSAQSEKFGSTLQQEVAKQVEEVKADLAVQHEFDIAMLKEAHVKSSILLHNDVSKLYNDLSHVNRVVDSTFRDQIVSRKLHALSASLLLLQNALATSKPFEAEWKAVKSACADDAALMGVLNAVPMTSIKKGVPTVSQLRDRLSVVKDEVRKAALAPQAAPPLLGQVVGNILAFVSLEPKGMVEGDDIEAALSRAAYFMDHENISKALGELGQIKGYPRTLLADWEKAAKERLVAEQSLSALRSAAAVRHLQL